MTVSKGKQFNMRIDADVYAKLEYLAEVDDRSLSSYVRIVLRDHCASPVAGRILNERTAAEANADLERELELRRRERGVCRP